MTHTVLQKWLGEQIIMETLADSTLTIVRPAIIESTLQEPVPGWVEGVKVADAIILAYAREKTPFFPARANGVIDIVPADLVANSLIMAAAETLALPGRHRIYQCSSGSVNPITVGRIAADASVGGQPQCLSLCPVISQRPARKRFPADKPKAFRCGDLGLAGCCNGL